MRLQGQRRNHRNAPQKENNIPRKRVGHFTVQINLVIRPLELPHHPHRATQSQQHPEYIPAPVRCSRIDQQAGVSDQRDKALHYVAKRAQRWALFQIERDPGVNSEENGPGGQKQGDSAGIRHSFTYTLFYGRERKRSGSDSLDHSVMITQPRDNHPTSTFRSTGGGGGIRTPAALAGSTV